MGVSQVVIGVGVVSANHVVSVGGYWCGSGLEGVLLQWEWPPEWEWSLQTLYQKLLGWEWLLVVVRVGVAPAKSTRGR